MTLKLKAFCNQKSINNATNNSEKLFKPLESLQSRIFTTTPLHMPLVALTDIAQFEIQCLADTSMQSNRL